MKKGFKMYKKRFSKSSFKKEAKYSDIVDDLKNGSAGNAPQTKDDTVSDGINKVAMKDLPMSSYAFPVDPYREANQASEKYNFISPYNRKFSPTYKGNRNIDGGYVSQYVTSVSSKLLSVFDSVSAEIGVNYRYLHISRAVVANYTYTQDPDTGEITYTVDTTSDVPMSKETGPYNYPVGSTPYRGSQLLRKMYDAVVEAVSQLDATTFTYLQLNTSYSVISTLDIPDVQKRTVYIPYTSAKCFKAYVYTDVAAVILLMSIEYQTLLQSGLLAIKQVNKIKNYEKLMLKMNYNRQTGPLNQYFGQLNKVAFAQLLTSIKLNVMGEYTDADWAKNTNLLTQLVSRKADDMIDPVLEVQATYNFQHVCIALSKAPKFGTEAGDFVDDAMLKYSSVSPYVVWWGINTWYIPNDIKYGDRCTDVIVDNTGGVRTVSTLSMEACTHRLNELCGIRNTLAWSRGSNPLALARYNQVVWTVEGVDRILTRMKTRFGDLRTVFDKLNPLGIVNYRKGITVDPTNKLDAEPVDYLLVNDIFKTILSGNAMVTFAK